MPLVVPAVAVVVTVAVMVMVPVVAIPGRTYRAGERPAIVAAKALQPYPRARVRRVDEPAVADIDADVAETVEEHKITGAQVASCDVLPDAILPVRYPGDGHARRPPGPLHEAGAVIGPRAGATPSVGLAALPVGATAAVAFIRVISGLSVSVRAVAHAATLNGTDIVRPL
jgi:hypothetical protein